MNRDQFLLRDDVIFLNHGSFGACPRVVFDEYQRLQREIESQPLEFLDRRYLPRLAVARAALAEFLGCGSDDLVFVSNATTGLNIVARSLDLQPGDEILTTDHEYGALDRTWRFLCGKSGARYIRQTLTLPLTTCEQVVDDVWSGVTPRTRVLFLSHITSPTALRLPVEELVRRGREAGLITIVDGAHAPGQIDLDIEAVGADFYSGNCHKWMMAPKGAAFLHARPEAQDLLEPLVVSWGWESRSPGTSLFLDHQEWTGTRDPSAWLAVPAAIRFMQDNDWASERSRCRAMIQAARESISGITGMEPICPSTGDWFQQMHALPLPPDVDGPRLQTALREEFHIEIPVPEQGDRCFLRPSAQAYNTPDDYERLALALTRLLG
jgi:isopenicillin-N epimerase